ncbi:MAG: hypothetical protein HGA80_05575 [Candidatus Omnitrophica bacterium]|nr:hypothetical protein [Candidatus Omnitrophota bacterium]
MDKQGMSPVKIVGIAVVVIIAALFVVAMLVPFCQPRVKNYAVMAVAALRSMSTAAENYKYVNHAYPAAIAELLKGQPPYLDRDICQEGTPAYQYRCDFTASGYVLQASPVGEYRKDRRNKVYTIKTGGVLTPAQ